MRAKVRISERKSKKAQAFLSFPSKSAFERRPEIQKKRKQKLEMRGKIAYFAKSIAMKTRNHIILGALAWAAIELFAQQKPDKLTQGRASYYNDRLHGRRMANGKPYNRDSFTCAHLKYPLGTILKVRNARNDRECFVTVTDRGPYSKRFIIDLSRAAAKYLGILGSGFTEVEITPWFTGAVPYRLEDPPLPEIPELNLQYDPAAVYPDPAWKKDSTDVEEPRKVEAEE